MGTGALIAPDLVRRTGVLIQDVLDEVDLIQDVIDSIFFSNLVEAEVSQMRIHFIKCRRARKRSGTDIEGELLFRILEESTPSISTASIVGFSEIIGSVEQHR